MKIISHTIPIIGILVCIVSIIMFSQFKKDTVLVRVDEINQTMSACSRVSCAVYRFSGDIKYDHSYNTNTN